MQTAAPADEPADEIDVENVIEGERASGLQICRVCQQHNPSEEFIRCTECQHSFHHRLECVTSTSCSASRIRVGQKKKPCLPWALLGVYVMLLCSEASNTHAHAQLIQLPFSSAPSPHNTICSNRAWPAAAAALRPLNCLIAVVAVYLLPAPCSLRFSRAEVCHPS